MEIEDFEFWGFQVSQFWGGVGARFGLQAAGSQVWGLRVES